MKLEINLLHVASGPFFFASGKAKPDSYRFERVKGAEHIHRLTIDDVNGDKAAAVLKDLGLRLQQADIPVVFKIIVEDGDLDGAEALATVRAEAAAAAKTIQALEERLKKQPKESPAPESKGLTKEQEEFLAERDEMLVLLEPYAEGEDTPLDVLKRATAALKAQKPPETAKRSSKKPPK